jgi:23S rRNA (uridine2552-2'-O)-methyltransferase
MPDYKKPDYWQQKARKESYPARSVYKLKEIDEKFDLLKIPRDGALRVLDLGAAPGSWSLYTLQKMASLKTGFLAAADLCPLSREFDKGLFDGGNFFFIQGDMTAAQTRDKLIEKGPYSVIISDAASSTTGNRMVDTARSNELAGVAIDYAENALTTGGMLVFKIFQGDDNAVLLKRLKVLFETAKSFKPQACRDNSMEMYFIGINKKIGSRE